MKYELISKESANGVKWGVKIIEPVKGWFGPIGRREFYADFDDHGFYDGGWGNPSNGFWGTKSKAKKLLSLAQKYGCN